MSYRMDEVPKELVVDQIYAERELLLYTLQNNNTVILSKSIVRLDGQGDRKLKILEKHTGYLHKSHRNTYEIPPYQNDIYVTE